ncbi:MAG: glycosyl hydrolase family 28-related protein [Pirellulaceae bacterium]
MGYCGIQTFACLVCLAAVAPGAQAATVVNVRDLGAVGDGRTDDTKAIQRAIDQVAKTGGRVLLPPSRHAYMIHDALTIRASNTELYGPGATIKMADHAIDGKVIDCVEIVGTEKAVVRNVIIRGLTIDANYWQQENSYNPRGIDSDWATRVLIDKVTIQRAFVGLTFGMGVTHSEARDCLVTQWHNDGYDASGDGLSGSCHHIRFVRCRAVNSPNETDGGLAGSRDDAWELEDGCFDVELVDCVVENAGGTGFGVRNHASTKRVDTRNIRFLRCRATGLKSRGFYVRGGTDLVTVTNVMLENCQSDSRCTFYQGTQGIQIKGGKFTGPVLIGMAADNKLSRDLANAPAQTVTLEGVRFDVLKLNLQAGAQGKMRYLPIVRGKEVQVLKQLEVFGKRERLQLTDSQLPAPN